MGTSQEKFAELCDVHRTYVGSVERGEVNISVLVLERFCKALGVEPYVVLIPRKIDAEQISQTGLNR